jgi:hypothetical protein
MRTASLVLCLLATPVAAQEAGSASSTPGPSAAPATGSAPVQVPASPPAPDTAPVIEPPASAPPAPITAPVAEPPASSPPASIAAPVAEPSSSGPPAAVVPPATGQPGRATTTAAATPEQHQHLGLFIHIDTGVGYLRTTGSKGGSSFGTQGAALGVGLAAGWAPNDDWALALEFWSWRTLSASGLGPDTSVELQALGLNVTRNVVPINVFASVVVSGTRLVITDAGDYVEYRSSDIGFGLKVLVGKEWPVSSWVRLGLAGELFLSVNKDGGQTLRTLGAGLVFSCTGL